MVYLAVYVLAVYGHTYIGCVCICIGCIWPYLAVLVYMAIEYSSKINIVIQIPNF